MENARLFTLPSEPPLIYVSVFGTDATELAARIGDGYINTSPNHELLDHYTKSGGRGPMLPAVELAHQRLGIQGIAQFLAELAGQPGCFPPLVSERAGGCFVGAVAELHCGATERSASISTQSVPRHGVTALGPELWLSERGERILARRVDDRFACWRSLADCQSI